MSGQTLTGVKIKSVTISPDDKLGQVRCNGTFALELGNGMTVAKQDFGGAYDDFKLAISAETMDLQNKFYNSLRSDITRTMGLS